MVALKTWINLIGFKNLNTCQWNVAIRANRFELRENTGLTLTQTLGENMTPLFQATAVYSHASSNLLSLFIWFHLSVSRKCSPTSPVVGRRVQSSAHAKSFKLESTQFTQLGGEQMFDSNPN